MSFHLLIEDQGLVLSAILVPFDSNWFMWFVLCPWAMLFFQKLCPAPFPPVTEGSGFQGDLGGLPMSLVVVCAGGMCSIVLLLSAFQLWCWR